MKTNAIKDLQTKSIQELHKLITDAKEEIFKARLEASQFKLKNVSSLSQMQDNLARMMTIARRKEIEKQNG